ncbi:DUF6443 domain-containing protein [Chitinophaga agrisoli]|nr:DUF6443 domain-containing protein [Chitinophaga agrisoli]
MCKRSLLLILLVYTGTLYAQNTPAATPHSQATPETAPRPYTNSTVNFIRTWEPSMPTADPSAVMSSTNIQEVKQSTQYFDGLGDPLQTVTKAISPAGKDMVMPVVYDGFGREQYKYPLYAAPTGDGKFKLNPFLQDSTFGAARYPGEKTNYSETVFEPSPLNRPLKSFGAGDSWALKGGNRPITQQYLVNTTADAVRIWDIAVTAVLPVSTRGVYEEGQLSKSVSVNEDGLRTVEFKDKKNQLILKRVELVKGAADGHSGWLSTYYVYDLTGALRCVIPPRATELIQPNWVLTSAITEGLCYLYRFDGRNRMIMKKAPGADSTEMVYDVRDRMVFSRDGELKADSLWMAVFYDGLNRTVMTALYKSTATRSTLQTGMNAAISNTQTITNTIPAPADLVISMHDGRGQYIARNSIAFEAGFDSGAGEMEADINSAGNLETISVTTANPLPGMSPAALTPLTYTFYDDYNYSGKYNALTGDLSLPQYAGSPYAEVITTPSTRTAGMVTGTKARILGTDKWIATSLYYTDKGRILQTISNNANEGKNVFTSLYDFSGKVLSTFQRHTNLRSTTTPQTTVMTQVLYDAAGRLSQIIKQLNETAATRRVIVQNSYDELGLLQRKRLGLNPANNKFLDSLDYEYNIRNWVKTINKAYINSPASSTNWFGLTISYDSGFTVNQYTGNIAGVRWKAKSNNIARAYGYTYDKVNRLITADFTQQNASGAAWTRDNTDFTVDELTYDANGNIMFMKQKGMNGTLIQTIDSLKYGYVANSNKLSFVTDRKNNTQTQLGDFKEINNNETIDYAYDSNGNLVKDLNKNIAAIGYNYLNLPESISITGKGSIKFLYDAMGNKLQKVVTDNTGGQSKTIITDYIDGFVYQNDTLQFLSHEEGRVRAVWNGTSPVSFYYDYFVKDNLGNTRVVLTDQPDLSSYTATMETAQAARETALFSNVEQTRTTKPVGYPDDQAGAENKFVAKLNAKDGGKKIGPSLVLRVMAGDTVQIGAKAFYKSTGPKDNKPVNPEGMLASLLTVLTGSASGAAAHGGVQVEQRSPLVNFNSADYQRLKQRDPGQNLQDKPRAWLNFALFDEQFNLVEDNSGVRQVKGMPDELQTLAVDKMPIKKTGFIYVYTSNETAQDVFFDNVVVNVAAGPLLEETHYYPFGLTMAGISNNVLKGTKYPENRYKFNGIEKIGDLGLEDYDAKFRQLDPQIGRWWEIDPKPDYAQSVYSAMGNNPVSMSDPLGDTVIQLDQKAQKTMIQDFNRNYNTAKSYFQFNSNGVLSFTQEGKQALAVSQVANDVNASMGAADENMMALQQSLEGMDKAMTSTESTTVVYSNDAIKGKIVHEGTGQTAESIRPTDSGGEFTAAKKGNPNGTVVEGRRFDNVIYVNPPASTTYNLNIIQLAPQFQTQERMIKSVLTGGNIRITNTRYNLLMHGIGHVLHQNSMDQTGVIKYDNYNRRISGSPINEDMDGSHANKP